MREMMPFEIAVAICALLIAVGSPDAAWPSPSDRVWERSVEVCERGEGDALSFTDDDTLATRVTVEAEGLLCVDGFVTDGFADWYAAHARRFDQVVMRSLGGRGAAGILTGEAALSAEPILVVWDYCISACANGIAMGAARFIVPEPAILAWHGTLARDRFEAVLLQSNPSPRLRRLQQRLLVEYEATGERRVDDGGWALMPAEARTAFEQRARWRDRSAAVLRKRGVHTDFLAASGFAPRHAPEAARRLSIERAGSLDPVLWVPGPDQLPRWDVDHIDTWAAGSEGALFTLGLAMEPQMVLTQVELQPDEFYALPPEAN